MLAEWAFPPSDLVSIIPCMGILSVVTSYHHQGSATSASEETASSLGTDLLVAEVAAASRGCRGY